MREAIVAAARSAFAERGYDAVSIRAVARDARVDPALVHRFYGSKEELFVAAMELPVSPGQLVPALLAEGVDDLGERLVRTLLELFDRPATFAPFLALIRGAVSNEDAAALLREFIAREVLGRLAAAASPDRPELRASLAGAQVIGLAMARSVVAVPPLAARGRRGPAAGHHRRRDGGGLRRAGDPAVPDRRAADRLTDGCASAAA